MTEYTRSVQRTTVQSGPSPSFGPGTWVCCNNTLQMLYLGSNNVLVFIV